MAWIRKGWPLAIALVTGIAVGSFGGIAAMEYRGWMSPDAAQQMAMRQTTLAVATEVAPYCVDRFIRQPDASKQWKSLQTAARDGADIIKRLGLARAPGATSDSPFTNTIASTCAERVRALTEVREEKSQVRFLQLFESAVIHVADHIVDFAVPWLIRGLLGLLVL
ncbi:MAG: hypothetical protein Q7S95_01665 [bacterium]|nr:hypothetical protein [bacterium]